MLLSKKVQKTIEVEIKRLEQLKKMLVESDDTYSINSDEYVESLNKSIDYYHECIKKGSN